MILEIANGDRVLLYFVTLPLTITDGIKIWY